MSKVNKRFYWLKLVQDFFEKPEIELLLSQHDGSGAKQVIIYLMLCCKTLNNNGQLYDEINNIIMSYDELKIQRDTKFFNIDTIKVAMRNFLELGLLEENKKGFFIKEMSNMVGSETAAAERKRKSREGKKALEEKKCDNVTTMSQQCHTEIEKEKDIEKDKDKDFFSLTP